MVRLPPAREASIMEMAKNHKRCPFCGGIGYAKRDGGGTRCKIECEDCKAHVHGTTLEDAHNKWNRRVV